MANEMKIKLRQTSASTSEATMGRHRVLIDRPTAKGGADAGPMITPFGSLATMLVLALARREGEEVRTREFVMLGLWAVPLIVVAVALVLALDTALAR